MTQIHSESSFSEELPEESGEWKHEFRHRFEAFQKRGQSRAFAIIFAVLLTFVFAPVYLTDLFFLDPLIFDKENPLILNIVGLVLFFLSVVCCWIVVALFRTTSYNARQWRAKVKCGFISSLTLSFTMQYIASVIQYSKEVADINDDKQTPEYPFHYLVMIIFVPYTANIVFRVTDQFTLVLTWLLVNAAMIAATWLIPNIHSFTAMIAYFTMSILRLLDSYYFNLSTFVYHSELETQVERFTQKALERKATELRDIIGNVAHDLKTPLTGIMTAIEMIQLDIESVHQTDQILPFATTMHQMTRNILTSLRSIRDIHAFMLMMINRSIDYKKASTGIALIPQPDSVHVSSLILTPIQILRNLQEKVEITVENSLPMNEVWIQTDKQWLQENLLCLLSNAVKYSTAEEGQVELHLSLLPRSALKKTPGQIQDDSAVRNSVMYLKEKTALISRDEVEEEEEEKEEATFRRVFNPSPRRILIKSLSHSKGPLITPTSFVAQKSNKKSIDDNDKLFLLFEVIDSSSGLSPQEMTMFFNPFKQKRLSGGTGLGLYSLAKRIEALGGQYGVHSRETAEGGGEQRGSVVWFTIPYQPINNEPVLRVRSEAATVEESHLGLFPENFVSEKTVLQQSEKKQLHGLRVLVVEDSPMIAKMTCMMLKKQNIETEVAENGQIAVEKVLESYGHHNTNTGADASHSNSKNRRYAAILMDFQMPVMDGIEATERIRAYEASHGVSSPVCIIGISAMSDVEIIEEGKAKGMNTFLPKPFACKDFLSYLQEFTRKEEK